MMHATMNDCIKALQAANAELQRQLDTLLESVKYLRKDVKDA